MVAHSQYCQAGDHTLEATQLATSQLATRLGDGDGGDCYLFVVSDCNLQR